MLSVSERLSCPRADPWVCLSVYGTPFTKQLIMYTYSYTYGIYTCRHACVRCIHVHRYICTHTTVSRECLQSDPIGNYDIPASDLVLQAFCATLIGDSWPQGLMNSEAPMPERTGTVLRNRYCRYRNGVCWTLLVAARILVASARVLDSILVWPSLHHCIALLYGV